MSKHPCLAIGRWRTRGVADVSGVRHSAHTPVYFCEANCVTCAEVGSKSQLLGNRRLSPRDKSCSICTVIEPWTWQLDRCSTWGSLGINAIRHCSDLIALACTCAWTLNAVTATCVLLARFLDRVCVCTVVYQGFPLRACQCTCRCLLQLSQLVSRLGPKCQRWRDARVTVEEGVHH